MDSVGLYPSFPMPTHTHIFGNHNNGYSHLKTATCGVQRIAGNQVANGLKPLTWLRQR
jgi:hypothetical protein